MTQLPAPNYHCRTPELTAIKPMPEHWWGHFYIKNLSQQVSSVMKSASAGADPSAFLVMELPIAWQRSATRRYMVTRVCMLALPT